MRKLTAILPLTVALLLVPCRPTLGQNLPDNVSGNWTIYSTGVASGQVNVVHAQIAQDGNMLTGYYEGISQAGPIQGEVNGHHIRFSTVTRNVFNFHGQVFGDNMTGTYGVHGRHAPWQAQRNPPLYPQQAPSSSVSPQPILSPQPEEAVTVSAAPAPAVQNAAAPASPAPALLTSEQLNALVAPIALYPDALVAQVFAAASDLDQITEATNWLAQNRNLTGTALSQAVDEQSWEPSVKSLTQFPSVLENLARNLSWTSSLGQAFTNQQADVMAAVQVMRAKAQAAGTLQSNSQISVVQQSPSTIVIQPANPQVVYVPQYDPAVVYGMQLTVPLYVPAPMPIASVGLYFGSGVSVGAVAIGGGWGGGFGWHAWNMNWGGGGTVIYNHTTYINRHTTIYNRAAQNGYRPGADTRYGPNGDYHPNGYYGPNGHFHHDASGANPKGQPNGGNNGNHGLIGGNGSVQHQELASNHANDPAARPEQDGSHGMVGGNGGVERDKHQDNFHPRQQDRRAQSHASRAEHHNNVQHHPQHMSAHRGGGGGGHRR
ncbi:MULTISPECIES: DUF3300 domain-containing protein [Acidobacteriaceae]|uniref:DUF3300 domain-containing protein n=1 Tax=Acidobacteriaceae TaxID=204434 RepID=UPI0020B10B2F|nr:MULTISPECIES: DUF3300 domain-containing protein [Acidobacteriaceae]MDW5266947.1 DUF3300 domain-containing protein [Edaphobacter sp.]